MGQESARQESDVSAVVGALGPDDPIARLAEAEQLLRKGLVAEAALAYRDIVARYPDASPAWAELALLALNSGDSAAAVQNMEQALSSDRKNPVYWRNLCELKRRSGDLTGAVKAGRRACKLAPADGEARFNLSLALSDRGDFVEAITLLRKVIEESPFHARAWNNLGHCLLLRGESFEAGRAFEQAIGMDASNAEAHHNLALIALRFGNHGEALKYFDRAIALNPQFAVSGQEDLRRLKEARDKAATNRKTEDDLAPGLALWAEGRFEEAVAFYRRLRAHRCEDLALLANLATALADAGHPAEAVEIARRALEIDPNCASVRLVLSTSQLELGLWEEGWRNYEFRFAGAHEVLTGQVSYANIPLPRWTGEDPGENASILVVVEQGYGDTIQFCRYLSLLSRRFARIGLLTSPPLARLLDWTYGGDVAVFTNYPSDYRSWDCHCMLMSLPHLFGSTLENFPAGESYLKIPASSKQSWRARLDASSKHKFRIGISWTGRPEHRFNAQRSIPDDQLQRLLSLPGATWVSLQRRAEGQPAPPIPEGVDWLDWSDELADFAVTAALVANLDLVIGIDSVNVHLAGALGRPVWLLNRFNSEWRWMAPREDSPWYPSLRVFRQSRPGDWASAIDRVVAAAAESYPGTAS